jgi:hypothetical protein
MDLLSEIRKTPFRIPGQKGIRPPDPQHCTSGYQTPAKLTTTSFPTIHLTDKLTGGNLKRRVGIRDGDSSD